MKLSTPIYTPKRRAKAQARSQGAPLSTALDHIARTEGFQSWGHLAATYAKTSVAERILRNLIDDELVLIAARPGQGKTLLELELSALAVQQNRPAMVFSLEYTSANITERLHQLGFDLRQISDGLIIDTSDDICAAHIVDRLDAASGAPVVVVDCLQLLDQKRDRPGLANQIAVLSNHARSTGATIILISQIDRRFDEAGRSMPGLKDVRLPNPIDMSVFERASFLHQDEISVERLHKTG